MEITQPPPAPEPPPVAPAPTDEPPKLRLPRSFVPASYTARLAIDPSKTTFDGAITIAGEVAQKTGVVWLHGRHLTVHLAVASKGDPFETPHPVVPKVTATPRGDDLLELQIDPPLEPGPINLGLEYSGEIDPLETSGAFKQTTGKESYVYSQFEPTYARRVFPSLDEPDSKVPWQLTLDVPEGLVAVSNTPVAHDIVLGNHMHRYEFARTKPLPSYLVAFGVGPFEIVPGGQTKSGVPVRIISLKGRAAEAAWAAQNTAHIIDLLEDWFGMPYPYPKLDLLAIPVTVGFGAMENPGLITGSERFVLKDPKNASWERRSTFVVVAAHELAHQWFGDYVTTAWWDDLWLNEGFANWMEGKITARFEPAWHVELGTFDGRRGALGADSIVSARRVRQPIETIDDILTAFDGITYDKGASVLDMFESYVGADVFQKGVREYIKAKAWGNATAADFVSAISAAAGKDVAPAFSTFLDQAGAPSITATVACDKGAPRVELAQERYVSPGSPAPSAQQPWIVPVCVAYERGGKRAEACTLVDKPTGTLALETKACPRWVMPNAGAHGYYRMQLTSAQATALRDEAWPVLTWTERREIYFEVHEATRQKGTRKLPLQLALSFVPKLLAGGDRFTTSDALQLPLGFDRLVSDDQRAKYEGWLRATFGPGATKVGVLPKDKDDLDSERVRGDLFNAVGWTGRDPELAKQAVELAAHWRDLPQSMRSSILDVAVDASPEVFAKVLAEIKTEPDRTKRGEMIRAVGAVRDPARLETALALVLDPAIDVRETMWMPFGASSEATRKVTEAFVHAHEDEILKKLPEESRASLTWAYTSACDASRRDQIATYVQKFASLPRGPRLVQQAIESMDLCIANKAALEPEIRAWLGGVKLPKPAKPK